MIRDLKSTELAIRQECDQVRSSIEQDQTELADLEKQRLTLLRQIEAKQAHIEKWESHLTPDPISSTRTKSR